MDTQETCQTSDLKVSGITAAVGERPVSKAQSQTGKVGVAGDLEKVESKPDSQANCLGTEDKSTENAATTDAADHEAVENQVEIGMTANDEHAGNVDEDDDDDATESYTSVSFGRNTVKLITRSACQSPTCL